MIELPHPDYFQGILQLRDCSKELIAWVKQRIGKDNRAKIAKEKKVRGGLDLYLSSQRYLRSFGKKLSETYAGEYKQSRTLHTVSKKTGKQLFRVTVMFRQLPFNKGDRIMYNGQQFEVLNIKTQAQLKNVETGKKEFAKIDDIRRAKKL